MMAANWVWDGCVRRVRCHCLSLHSIQFKHRDLHRDMYCSLYDTNKKRNGRGRSIPFLLHIFGWRTAFALFISLTMPELRAYKRMCIFSCGLWQCGDGVVCVCVASFARFEICINVDNEMERWHQHLHHSCDMNRFRLVRIPEIRLRFLENILARAYAYGGTATATAETSYSIYFLVGCRVASAAVSIYWHRTYDRIVRIGIFAFEPQS